jgi:predicted transglutaminase-like cysteine proteinase
MMTIGERRFWNNWIDRFQKNSDKYITPGAVSVAQFMEKIDTSQYNSANDMAMKMWELVNDEIDYRLSKVWKTPRQTITDSIGDCEDMTFLLATMFVRQGISNHEIAIGNIKGAAGREEMHTWNRVNGDIIDGTTTPKSVQRIEYEEVHSWTIKRV